MRILITGGTGLIGRQLCKALLHEGHELTVLSRNPQSVPIKCGPAVKAMQSLSEWTPDQVFDAVINLAGEPIIDVSWTEARKKRLWDSRVSLTAELVNRIERADQKPKVLLSGSAIGYYGDCGSTLVDETAPPASDFGAALCVAWEKAGLKAAESNVRVCFLRTGLVLDAAGGLLGKMLLPFKLGLGASLGSGHQWMSWIHIDDYVALVLRLLTEPGAIGIFNMTAPKPVSNKEFTDTLAKTLCRPAFLFAPALALKLGLGERAYLLLGGQRVIPAKAQALGYEFIYPELDGALKSLLG